MITQSNQIKFRAFKKRQSNQTKKKAYNEILEGCNNQAPEKINDTLYKLYLNKHVELSKDFHLLKYQHILLKLNLITIQNNQDLVLTKQGYDLCQHGFFKKSKIEKLINHRRITEISFIIFGIIASILTIISHCIGIGHQAILFNVISLTGITGITALDIPTIITTIMTITCFIVALVYTFRLTSCNDNRIQLTEIKSNLKKYCKNDYQLEFHKFLRTIWKMC